MLQLVVLLLTAWSPQVSMHCPNIMLLLTSEFAHAKFFAQGEEIKKKIKETIRSRKKCHHFIAYAYTLILFKQNENNE
jgi:hypothetical protein